MTATSTIRLDLDALAGNLEAVAALDAADGTPLGIERLCAVVKADGYGLGAARIAAAMHRIGVRRFAAYGVDEAIEVAEASPASTVLVLQPLRTLGTGGGLPGLLSRGRLHLTAHQVGQVEELARDAARLGVVLPLHLEVDTGMGRSTGAGSRDIPKTLGRSRTNPIPPTLTLPMTGAPRNPAASPATWLTIRSRQALAPGNPSIRSSSTPTGRSILPRFPTPVASPGPPPADGSTPSCGSLATTRG